MRRIFQNAACCILISLSPAKAEESSVPDERNKQPPSVIDLSLDPCRYFTSDEPMVGFFIAMELEERRVPMRVPKRYLEDRFDHEEGAEHGTQLFSIEVPTFEPITRPETGRRNAAKLPWNWMHFVVTDQLPVDKTIGHKLRLPISLEDIGKPRTTPDWRDFPHAPAPYGLTRVVAPDRLGGEDLFVHLDEEGGLAGWMHCSVPGLNRVRNGLCVHTTRLSGMDVLMSFRRTELPNWKIIHDNVAQFLTCATSDNI